MPRIKKIRLDEATADQRARLLVNGAPGTVVYNPDEDIYESTVTPFDINVVANKGLRPSYKRQPLPYHRYNPDKWVSARTKQLSAADASKAFDTMLTPALSWALPNPFKAIDAAQRGDGKTVAIEGIKTIPWAKGISWIKPGSSFWMNPVTRQVAAGSALSSGVDLGTNILSNIGHSIAPNAISKSSSFSDAVGQGVEEITGWNPNNTIAGKLATETLNPGWWVNPNKAEAALANGIAQGKLAGKRTLRESRNLFNDVFRGGINKKYDRIHKLEQEAYSNAENYKKREYDELSKEWIKYANLENKARYIRGSSSDNPHTVKGEILGTNGPVRFSKMSTENRKDFFKGKVENYEDIAASYNPETGRFEHLTQINDGGFNIKDAVKTGKFNMKDLRTGKSQEFNIDLNIPYKTSRKDFMYDYGILTEEPLETVSGRLNPELPVEYIDALQRNMDYVTKTLLPGSKSFGSTSNIVKGNLAHASHDFDVIMTEAQMRNSPNFKEFVEVNPGNTWQYKPKNSDEPIDINILREKHGNAYGQRAHELYSQYHPAEYRALMEKYARKGKDISSTDLQLDISAKKLLDEYDPVVKGIADAFGSNKSKHMKRALYYLHYGNVDDVRKGFDMYANYLLGGNYKPTNVPLSEFSNPDRNLEIIDKLGLKAINESEFINDPERMKLLFDYATFYKTFYGRGVDENPLNSLTTWLPDAPGGSAHGVGLNTVLGGNSGYGTIYGTLIPNRSPNLSSYTRVDDVINSFPRNKKLTTIEQNIVKKLEDKYNINISDKSTLSSILNSTSGKNGQKYKDFIKDLSEEFNIPTILNGYFGNAPYASFLEDQSTKAIQQFIPQGLDRPVPAMARDEISHLDKYIPNNFFAEAQKAINRRIRKHLIDKSEYPLRDLVKKRRDKVNDIIRDKQNEIISQRRELRYKNENNINTLRKKLNRRANNINTGAKLTTAATGIASIAEAISLAIKLLNKPNSKRLEYEKKIQTR